MLKFYIAILTIIRFRCIRKATIKPIDGVNLFYGGNDSGKTTVLNAIGLAALLDSSIRLVDSDFFMKEVGEVFRIELTIECEPIQGDLPPVKSEFQSSGVGRNHALIDNSAIAEKTDKKFKLKVIGTNTMELKYLVSEVVGMRKSEVETVLNSFAETRIVGNAKPSDHLFEKADLKNTVSLERISSGPDKTVEYVVRQMGNEPLDKLSVEIGDLNKSFRGINLPLISETSADDKAVDGLSLANLKLSGGRLGVEFPLRKFGAGTQELVPRLYSESSQGSNMIQLTDDPEGRLDTIKQHNYLEHIGQWGSQVFASIHHTNLNDLAQSFAVWVCSPPGNIFQPTGERIKRFQLEHPNIFKHKLIIIAEGKTEVGFITAILTLVLGKHPKFFGIIVIEGHGNPFTAQAVKQCHAVGLKVGAFVDSEPGVKTEFGDELNEFLKDLFYQWKKGCMEENVIPAILEKLTVNRLHEFISHPEPEKTEARLKSIASCINLTLNSNATPEKAVNQIWDKILNRKDFKKLFGEVKNDAAYALLGKVIVAVSSGRAPKGIVLAQKAEHILEKFGSSWFKSIEGGEELFEKMYLFGAWKPTITLQLMPSIKAYLEAVGVTPVDELPKFNLSDAKWCDHVNVK